MNLRILLVLILSISTAYSRDLWNARLLSTSGSGVASMLVEEAAYLNPAPLAFFDTTHVYYSSYAQKIEDKNTNERVGSLYQMDEINGDSVTIVDSKNTYKGSFSYQGYRQNKIRRSRYVLSMGKAAGKKSAIGLSFRHTRDKHPENTDEEKKYNQIVIGTTHVINPSFTVGAVIIDPLGKIEEESRALVGFQYIFSQAFLVTADIGGNIKEGMSETFIQRTGLQINFFKQVFLRLGFFSDKAENTKGDSYGIAWIGPKTSFEFALKNSSLLDEDTPGPFAFTNERVVESAFSFSLRY